jgi:predicted SnoaL-like aldol condensation-catalyzing enzyme
VSRAIRKSFVPPCLLLAMAFAACDPRPSDPPVAASGESRVAAVIAHPAPLAALEGTNATLAANKRLVFDLWRGIVNAGHIEMADHMLAEHYIQHSPVLPTGREAFKQIFSVVPRRDIPVLVEPPLVQIVAEGDLVVMSLLELIPAANGQPAYTTTHFNLFRVENGRLAEHWHSVQAPPGPDVLLPEEGGPQPVTGATGQAQRALLASADPRLAQNKQLVFDMWREVVDAGHQELASRYLDASFVERSPAGAAGREGFSARYSRPAGPIEPAIGLPVVALVAERDLVVLVTMREHPHPVRTGMTYTTTWFDMFRVVDGRILEHWDPALRGSVGAGDVRP